MHKRILKVLFEMRPALDGHAGIPQETRLLFGGLSSLQGLKLEGMIQSSNRLLRHGLTGKRDERRAAISPAWAINRMSRVVVSLRESPEPSLAEASLSILKAGCSPLMVITATLFGRRQKLSRFDAGLFRDFVWRAMFSRTMDVAEWVPLTSAAYRIVRHSWTSMHLAGLLTRKFGRALYPRLDTHGFDVMIVETPFPGRASPGTRMVVRYHDAIPVLMPHTISDRSYHQAAHFNALARNVQDGAWFACVSDASRKDLLSMFPQVEDRAVTVPNMVSSNYYLDDSVHQWVPEILAIRKNQSKELASSGTAAVDMRRVGVQLQYLLMVSTVEPRKNHLALLGAWERLRATGYPRLELVIVGSLGWDHELIVRKLKPWLQRGGLHMLEDVPTGELRALYRHAAVTVCPSFGEGFDFSGVEAMRCGGLVAASDIPVHREVFDDAAEYFNPYSEVAVSKVIQRLLDPEFQSCREQLVRRGEEVSRRYLPECILPVWSEFLERVQNES